MSDLPSVPNLDSFGDLENGQWLEDRRGDEALHVEFYQNPVDGLDHVKIIIPGDERTQPDFIADESYKARFPRQWAIYNGQLEEFSGQTRVETVAWIDPGTVGEMKRNRIHTVEQLANMSDSSMDQANMLFLRKFRERAKKHLEDTAASSGYDELKAQNETLAKQIEALQEQINQVAVPKRGPGRPPKVA